MTIKEIFEKAENGTLTFEQFTELAKEAKFADLTTGEYVAKRKYEDEVASKESQISTLNETISNRDKDLKALKQQLEEAVNNTEDKDALSKLTQDMASLQEKYNADMKAYKTQLAEQSYDFAVKEYANTLEFSSLAAKRDFTEQMRKAGLKMEGDKILGADDFKSVYATDNADAFKLPAEPVAPEPEKPLPKFVEPTGAPAGKKLSLSELMRMKNENPDVDVNV